MLKLSNRRSIGIFLLLFAFTVASTAAAEGDLWMTDMEKAMEKAQKENKDLLLDFTGSDWCGWCTKLTQEIFGVDVFKKEAPKHFVLVKLDFPRRTQISPELQKQNRKWQQKLNVTGFPTIFLTDGKGRPYAKTGYQRGGAEKYLEHLAEFRAVREKRDKAFKKAEKAKGLEKAKLLDEALSAMDPAFLPSGYKKEIEEILALDKENKAGLKDKYGVVFAINEVNQLMQQRNTAAALKKIDETFNKYNPKGQSAQDLYFLKANVAQDRKVARAAFEAALKAAPKGKKSAQITMILKQYFSKVMDVFSQVTETMQQDKDKALEIANAAIKDMKPKGNDAHVLYFAKGYVLMQKDDKDGARSAFEIALKEAPGGRFARYINQFMKTKLKEG